MLEVYSKSLGKRDDKQNNDETSMQWSIMSLKLVRFVSPYLVSGDWPEWLKGNMHPFDMLSVLHKFTLSPDEGKSAYQSKIVDSQVCIKDRKGGRDTKRLKHVSYHLSHLENTLL